MDHAYRIEGGVIEWQVGSRPGPEVDAVEQSDEIGQPNSSIDELWRQVDPGYFGAGDSSEEPGGAADPATDVEDMVAGADG